MLLMFGIVHGNWVWYPHRFIQVVQNMYRQFPQHTPMTHLFSGQPLFCKAPLKSFFPSCWRLTRLRADNQWRYRVLLMS